MASFLIYSTSAYHLTGGVWDYLLLSIFGLLQGYLAAMLGAVASARGSLDPWLVFLSVSSIHVAADNFWYFLGRAWGVEKAMSLAQKVGFGRESIPDAMEGLELYSARILFLSKLTSGMTIPALIAAGVTGVRWRKAFLIMAIGEAIRTGVIVILGYRLTLSVEHLEFWTQLVAILGGLFVLGLSAHVIRRYAKRASSPSDPGKRP